MTVQLVQVEWRGRDIDGSTDTFTFDDIIQVNIKKDSQVKESHATIVLQNAYDRFETGFTQPFSRYNQKTNDLRFKEGDTVKIYAAEITSFRALDTSSGSADLIMTGEIAEVNVKGEGNSAKITLRIVDKTYVILNKLYTFAYTSTSALNAPEIIQ